MPASWASYSMGGKRSSTSFHTTGSMGSPTKRRPQQASKHFATSSNRAGCKFASASVKEAALMQLVDSYGFYLSQQANPNISRPATSHLPSALAAFAAVFRVAPCAQASVGRRHEVVARLAWGREEGLRCGSFAAAKETRELPIPE